MKSLKNASPYTKMYLVTPKIYEQVLSCLDEKDKKITEDLNADKDTIEERPSEKFIDMLNKEELNPVVTPETEMIESPATLPPVHVTDEFMSEEDQPSIKPSTETQMVQDPEDIPLAELRRQNKLKNVQDPEDIPLAQLKRENKLDYLAGRIKFTPQDGRVFTCKICLKAFPRNWGLARHMATVHKNIPKTVLEERGVIEKPFETNVPAMLNIQSKNSLPNYPNYDINMDEENPLKKPCSISADTSDRIIPDPQLYFKPPRSREIVVPTIKKRMFLKHEPKIIKKKNNQENVASDDLMNFDDWPEQKKTFSYNLN